jgi:hypothetical protein
MEIAEARGKILKERQLVRSAIAEDRCDFHSAIPRRGHDPCAHVGDFRVISSAPSCARKAQSISPRIRRSSNTRKLTRRLSASSSSSLLPRRFLDSRNL